MGVADGGLRKTFKDHLPKPDWRWTPIETRGTHNGVPDSFYLHRPSSSHGWLECKITTGWAVKFEPMQIAWLMLHSDGGVPCWIAVRASGVGSGGGSGDSLWLLHGLAAETLSKDGLRCDPSLVHGVWFGKPAEWNWKQVTTLLTSKLGTIPALK